MDWQVVTFRLPRIAYPYAALGLRCDEPINAVQIDWIKVYSPTAEQCFRKEVVLPETPVDARMCVIKNPEYEVFINGVSLGTRRPRGKLDQLTDLARHFRKGRNVVCVRAECWSWAGLTEWFVLEGMVRCKSGPVVRICTDETWRTTFNAPEGWHESGSDDGSWPLAKTGGKPQAGYGFSGRGYYLNPPHYGPIDLQVPQGGNFLYDFGKPVVVPVRVFAHAAQADYAVKWRLSDAETEAVVARGTLTAQHLCAREFVGRIEFGVPKPGAYELALSLAVGKETVEERIEEIAVLGPIPQREVQGASYTEGLDLEPTDEIDCADPQSPYRFFSQTWRGVDVDSPIRKTKLGAYRETGKGVYDWFGFGVKVEHPGEAYLAEVDVPDDAERIMSVRVVEMTGTAGGLCNDGRGLRGWGLSAAGVYTGVEHPLTHSFRKLRFVFFPKTKAIGLICQTQMSGRRAAAGKVRLYRIKGGLPALRVPSPSYRYTGQHAERISCIPYTFFSGADDIKFCTNLCMHTHRGLYKNWYNTTENLIRYMRFTGENMIILGIYMYYRENGWMWHNRRDANVIELMARMLDANGIKAILVVRAADYQGRTYFYVLNPTGYALGVQVGLRPSRPVRDLCLGTNAPLGPDGLALKPFEMRSFVVEDGIAAIDRVTATASPQVTGELARLAEPKVALYRHCREMETGLLQQLIQSMGLYRTPNELVQLAAAIEQAHQRGDHLGILRMTSSFGLQRLESVLAAKLETLDAEPTLSDFVFVNCGSDRRYVDSQGRTWLADQAWNGGLMPWGFIRGGTADRGDVAIANTPDPKLYLTERYAVEGYRFKVTNGRYLVRLHFAETWLTDVNQRLFDVSVQGREALESFDVVRAAGGHHAAVVKSCHTTVSDAVLRIDFARKADSPEINAIEVMRMDRDAKRDALMLHYDFAEAQGAVLGDRSGQGLDARIQNAQWVETDCGPALRFRGRKCTVAGPTDERLDMGLDDWTITLLVKTPVGDTAVNNYLICKGAGAGFNGYRLAGLDDWQLTAIIGTSRELGGYKSASGRRVPGISINDGHWHFLSAVFKRDSTLQLYVDGRPAGKPRDISMLRDKPVACPYGLRIWLPQDERSSCTIADCALYRKALSADDLCKLRGLLRRVQRLAE